MRTMAIAALAAGVAASSAAAGPTYSFHMHTAPTDWSGTRAHNGMFEPVRAAFDPVTNRLLFEATLAGAFADGLAVAGSPEHIAAGRRDEMDRFSTGSTGGYGRRQSVHAGRPSAEPDRFVSARDGVGGAVRVDTTADTELLGKLTLSVDAANILGYNPDGAGAGSSDSFGFWLHSLRRFDTNNRDRRGPGVGGDHARRELEDSSVIGANLTMNVVPLPSGAAMAALGLVGIATRRRRD